MKYSPEDILQFGRHRNAYWNISLADARKLLNVLRVLGYQVKAFFVPQNPVAAPQLLARFSDEDVKTAGLEAEALNWQVQLEHPDNVEDATVHGVAGLNRILAEGDIDDLAMLHQVLMAGRDFAPTLEAQLLSSQQVRAAIAETIQNIVNDARQAA